jgi:hypothetical protein
MWGKLDEGGRGMGGGRVNGIGWESGSGWQLYKENRKQSYKELLTPFCEDEWIGGDGDSGGEERE